MKKADQAMLRDIRQKITSLAKDLKMANDQGYGVSFSINNVEGTVAMFDVKQMIPIDLDADVQ